MIDRHIQCIPKFLNEAGSINHIVVFLTGLQPLPHGFGASIFISWPSTEKAIGSAEWNNLGFISNEKPSAIFRVGQHSNLLRTQTVFVGDQTLNTEGAKNAFLGIMLEPLNHIQNNGQIAAQSTAEKQQVSVNDFAQKMLRNFVNYIQSFAVSLPKHDQMLTSVTTEMAEYVPTKAVTDWFNNFQRKLQMKPDFWRALPL